MAESQFEILPLGLHCTDLILDYAIYYKALEILLNPKNEDLNKFINLQMGGFHVSCIFIAVIGKRFGAGLKDLLIKSGITGTSSVDCILRGKEYNWDIRALKFVTKLFKG